MSIGKYFEGIGISGWSELEPAILCALKTKTPINLIGDKGTSKTEFCYRIARALQGPKCNFQKYDTPDVSLDMILGFMNLKKMEEGVVDFVRTGTSIWEKTAVLWDEINRPSQMLQGKLLEVIRTNTIHGLKTDVVYQFATCNPPRALKNSVGHDVHFLGEALASRFFHVHVPQTTLALYDAAMQLAPVRKAFHENDTEAIGKYVKPLYLLWMEYDRDAPDTNEVAMATAITRKVLDAALKSKYFDTRAAIRCTDMLAELFCLNRLQPFNNLIPSIETVVLGNIVELNGIIRNDRSGDIDNMRSVIKQAAQISIKNISTKSQTNLVSMPFSMLRDQRFDEISINNLLRAIDENPVLASFELSISSMLKKVPIDNKFRSPAFRANHKKVLECVLKHAWSKGFSALGIKMLTNETISAVMDNEADAVKIANDLHSSWYKAVGL